MAGETQRFGPDPANQFKAALAVQNDHNISGSFNPNFGFAIFQNGGENAVFFPDPKTMRAIAALLIESAEQWERGEFPRMKKPE